MRDDFKSGLLKVVEGVPMNVVRREANDRLEGMPGIVSVRNYAWGASVDRLSINHSRKEDLWRVLYESLTELSPQRFMLEG